ncbi:MAG: hypothetical protein JWN86_4271 [Planctomycetota bacterium]|nr:hypothetical protein [Planctomycetota bacterium]
MPEPESKNPARSGAGEILRPWMTTVSTTLRRSTGRGVVLALTVLILAAPGWLFADSLESYRIQGDDFSFVGASRDFARALENLFVPHNAHIVPVWRLLTWALVASAGSLANVPRVLSWATWAITPMVMLATGLLVARETGRTSVGLAAMAVSGTTSVLKAPATWYSAGQTLWAGLGVILTLLALQSWRKNGGAWRLILAALAAVFAGGFWTIGHVAGPAGAAYLLADGTRRSRRAALVPLLASLIAVGVSFGIGARKIEVEIRFEGGDKDKAMSLRRGASHTLQSISETLAIGNLGIAAETTPLQASILTFAVLGLWGWTFRNGGRPTPLECAGGVIVTIGYLVSWTFRGYYAWENLRGVVPWYDTIPHLGAVLFVAGWWSRVWNASRSPRPLTWAGAIGVAAFALSLVAIHQPRVTLLFIKEVPKLTEKEAPLFPVVWLQRLRAVAYSEILSRYHREHLYRLDRAEAESKRLGIGRDLIHRAFGRVYTPGLPAPYDAVEMLDLPRGGTATDPQLARAALSEFFLVKPQPDFPLESVPRLPR